MINLLPPKEKEFLIQEKKLKMILILEMLFFLFLCFLSLALFLINVYVFEQVNFQKALLIQEEEKLEEFYIQGLQEKIVLFNQTIFKLDAFYKNQVQLIKILEKTYNAFPVGIYLNTLFLNRMEEKENEEKKYIIKAAFSGYAPDRKTLLEFKQNLENEERITEVKFSEHSWLDPTNFSVSFSIK